MKEVKKKVSKTKREFKVREENQRKQKEEEKQKKGGVDNKEKRNSLSSRSWIRRQKILAVEASVLLPKIGAYSPSFVSFGSFMNVWNWLNLD